MWEAGTDKKGGKALKKAGKQSKFFPRKDDVLVSRYACFLSFDLLDH